MLETEYKYFQSIRNDLVNEHLGKYAAIQDRKLLGVFESEKEALESMAGHKLGTFLVKECVPEDKEEHRFHSRVAFA